MKAAPIRDVFHVVGTLLDGKYRVDRVVAEGGFGVVYAGYHSRLDVLIAVKLLKPNRLLEEGKREEQVASFLEEARTTAKLRHANIAQVLDTGVLHTDEHPEGVPWTVFEWLDGVTLDVDLKARRGSGGRSIQEVWKLMAPAIDAVAVAHEAGIAHRDLKPSNIMLVKERDEVLPHVLDFGIAKLIEDPEHQPSEDTTESAYVAFSPGYAAPEQLARARTGFWTDVHALGLILTELLIDQRPYGPDLAASVVNVVRPTPKYHGVDVGDWEPVLARALALATRSRHANARELYRALEAALTGEAPTVREKHAPVPAVRAEIASAHDDFTAPASETALDTQVVRKRSPIGLGIALVGLAAIGVFGTLLFRPTSEEPTPPSAMEAAPSAPVATAADLPSAPPPVERPPPSSAPSDKKTVAVARPATKPKTKPAPSASPSASTQARVGATQRFE